MVKKIIKFDIYIKTSEQTPTYSYTAKQKVMSNDKDSTQITFNLLDVAPEELSGSSASILLYMEDGSFFQKSDVTINRNSVIYTMKPEETRHSGNTKVQIVLNKGTVQTASLIYNFEIERGLEKFPIVEKEIQDWTSLTAEAKAFVEQIKDFTLEGFVENKMGEELANLETNYATRLTGLEQKDNQLTAQLAQTVVKEGYIYTEVTSTKHNKHNTDYYITRIPNKDKHGDLIKLKHGIAKDNLQGGSLEVARDFSERHGASMVVNAGIFNTSNGFLQGTSIIDGTIVNKEGSPYYTLGIKNDNTFVIYEPNTSPQYIISDGCDNAISAHYPLIQNGVEVGSDIYNLIDNWNEPYQRQIIAQNSNTKEIIIFTCDGKGINENIGMTYPQCVNILLGLGATVAYALDGGGSAQTIVNGVAINQMSDGRGYKERAIADFIYVVKEHEPNFTDDINKRFGVLNKELNDLKRIVRDNTQKSFEYLEFENEANGVDGGLIMYHDGVKKNKLYLRPDRLTYFDYETGQNIVDFDLSLPGGRFKIKGEQLRGLSESALVEQGTKAFNNLTAGQVNDVTLPLYKPFDNPPIVLVNAMTSNMELVARVTATTNSSATIKINVPSSMSSVTLSYIASSM